MLPNPAKLISYRQLGWPGLFDYEQPGHVSQPCCVLGYRRNSFYRFKVSMRELALQDISRKTAGFVAGLLKI